MSKEIRGILIGAATGALLGAALAWAVLSREEEIAPEEPAGRGRRRRRAGAGDWFKLGLSILQAGRQLADLVRTA